MLYRTLRVKSQMAPMKRCLLPHAIKVLSVLFCRLGVWASFRPHGASKCHLPEITLLASGPNYQPRAGAGRPTSIFRHRFSDRRKKAYLDKAFPTILCVVLSGRATRRAHPIYYQVPMQGVVGVAQRGTPFWSLPFRLRVCEQTGVWACNPHSNCLPFP